MAPITNVVYYRDHQEASARVLRFLNENVGAFRAMNVQLRAEEVPKPGAKGSKAKLSYLRRLGVDEVPALVTPSGVYLGVGKIFDICEKNIRALEAAQQDARRQKRAKAGSGDVLHDYMLEGLGGDDGGDEAMDATPDFGASMQAAMKKRLGRPGAPAGPGGGGPGGGGATGGDDYGGGNEITDVPVRAPPGGNQDDLLLAAFLDNNETTM